MKRQYWFIMAALPLFLNGCCQTFYAYFTEQISSSDYGTASKGVNLHAPNEQIIFHDDDSFYFFAPVETFKRRWSLFSTSRSSALKIIGVKKQNEKLFVRVTPHINAAPSVTVWISEKHLTYSINPSPDGNRIHVTLIGDNYQTTLKFLRPYHIDKKTDKDIESLFKRHKIPLRARIGTEDGKVSKDVGLLIVPFVIGSAAIDGSYFITMNLTNFCFRTLIGGNGIGCNENEEKPVHHCMDAEVIQL